MKDLFSPCISLRWRGFGGKLTEHYYPDRMSDRPWLETFMREAGLDIRNGIKITINQMDVVLAAASNFGYSIKAIGGPND